MSNLKVENFVIDSTSSYISDDVSTPPSLSCTNDWMRCSMRKRTSGEGIRIQSLRSKDLWRSARTVGHCDHLDMNVQGRDKTTHKSQGFGLY